MLVGRDAGRSTVRVEEAGALARACGQQGNRSSAGRQHWSGALARACVQRAPRGVLGAARRTAAGSAMLAGWGAGPLGKARTAGGLGRGSKQAALGLKESGSAWTLPEVVRSRPGNLRLGSVGYALFFMFQNGMTSGIATMSESVSR